MNAVRIRPAKAALLQARYDAQTRAAEQTADRPDHGTHTPAQAARPQRTIETIAAGVTRRVYDDATLADRMHRAGQLSDRQHAAAYRMMELHDKARMHPRQCGSYSPRGWHRGHTTDTPEASPVTRFRNALGSCTIAGAWLLHGLALDQHPGIYCLPILQRTLDELADDWGFA